MSLRLAWAEARRQANRFDPKLLLAIAAFGLLVGGVVAVLDPGPPQPDSGLWIVEVGDSLLREAAESERRLRVVDGDGALFNAGRADLLLVGDNVWIHENDRSRAAAEVLEAALRRWLDDRLSSEGDDAAAFPLRITVAYEPRIAAFDTGASGPDEPGPGSDPSTDPGNDPGSDPGGPGSDPSGPPPADPPIIDDVAATTRQDDIRPDQLEPPFPIRSLLLTFAYVIPAGLLGQVHSAALHGERTRHRGTLLLSTPLSPAAILLGKTLPAAGLTVLLSAIVTVVLGAGWLGFLASLSFLGFLFSTTTFLALISRSLRELTLSQVAVTTLLNVFLFLPAMFPNIPPVAFLSPIHVITSGIRGEAVAFGPFLYATLPLGLAAVGLMALAIGMMREEFLFSTRSHTARLGGAIGIITRRYWRVLVAGILVVPFVFAAQIFTLVTTAVMGISAALLLFIPVSVLLEEIAKGIPVWSRMADPRGPRHAWLIGVLVGTGFWIGEKSYLVLTLVGFESLPYGQEALALLGTGPGIALLMMPLGLHIVTGILLALGARAGRTWKVLGFLAAVGLHFLYDDLILRGGF